MNVYEYVAESNPQIAEQILNSFNYDTIDAPDMGLRQLVDLVGKPALKKVMENHPDKDIILEMFSKEMDRKEEKSCGCDTCRNKSRNEENLQYLNMTGTGKFADEKSSNSTTNTHLLANQTNVILVVSALFIATALILKNK
jgi:hypothetical protein